MSAPKLGTKLVRLLYLDEAGTDFRTEVLVVAGVLVHGDKDPREIDARFDALRAKYLPEANRRDFVFHATDIYHGSDYWDRRKWDEPTRYALLADLGAILRDLQLPAVSGAYSKAEFGHGIEMSDKIKRVVIQSVAVMDCAMWADRWLAYYQPDENAMIIAEDTDRVKRVIKQGMAAIKNPARFAEFGLTDFAEEFELPLKRILDTVYYTDKQGSQNLQLADLVAFALARSLNRKHFPHEAWVAIWPSLAWISSSSFARKRLTRAGTLSPAPIVAAAQSQ